MSETAPQSSTAPAREAGPGSTASMVTLPLVHVKVSPEHLTYFAALGVLTALEVIEWPLTAVMIVWQILATRAHRRIVREFAAGVEEAV